MYCSQWFTFEIPDIWWDAAGMRDFRSHRKAYQGSRPSTANDTMIVMLVDSIGVAPRSPNVPNFERDRMISVLQAIRLDRALPPIEVTKTNRQDYVYALCHGRHRLAASIAVGFSLIPAVVVRSLNEIKRSEGMA